MKRFDPLKPLLGDQRQASDPADLIWLSASAGTGKTQVLTARVLRLLLHGVRPETILCLTFTKAAAAEMAERIHGRLAHWVRLADKHLRKELYHLGENNDDAAVARARTLFARVLDAPGGGLRIQTIHAFCQTLLAAFPAEAGLIPGFRPLEGREEAALARRTLADLLAGAERSGDLGLIRDVETLSRRLGEGKAEAYLHACARASDAMRALGSREGIEPRLRRALEVPLGEVDAAIELACGDADFDCETLRAIATANDAWGTKTGRERAEIALAWLASGPAGRSASLAELHLIWAKADGELRSFKQAPQDQGYEAHCRRLHERCAALLTMRERARLAALLAAGLRAGQSYALAYEAAKRTAGLVDFDDLIRTTVALLGTPGMGDWVRYKLDQATDHILVDEAQDTNLQQWLIVASLAGEFFAEEPGRESRRRRTIFTVGDFKQAIFSFQGTDPAAFEHARQGFSARANEAGREILRLSLDRSFRSTPPILELVDEVIDGLGYDRFGLPRPADRHLSAHQGKPGRVTLWRPLSAGGGAADLEDEGEEGWLDDATREFASRLARQIRQWIDERMWLAARGRPVRPEDILVLVRKRGALASLIVARLYAENVPVAGVDRLRLSAPLAVRDLLAAMRFTVQPEDDLTLAGLLVSPLFGWSQEQLYRVGHARRGSLWRALREDGHRETVEALNALLAGADFTTPYRFLETILSGPLDGRRKLLRRLGAEARDPIEELLNSALQFESDATPSLQRFLDWFDRGEVEIKRDPSAPHDAVRVMTVHGAKGLQAPLVILADATGDPEASPAGVLDWEVADGVRAPVFRPRKAELGGSLAAAADAAAAREEEEHWRLLYVALTRAEEHLVIGGALGPRTKGNPPPKSWYQAVDRAMASLGAEWIEDPIWSGARYHEGGSAGASRTIRAPRPAPPVPAEPPWLRQPAAPEARPPRPLAPSSLGTDAVADPPPSPAMLDAARRGKLLHALFERLPQVAPQRQWAAADRWLRGGAGVAEEELRHALIEDACGIIADPAFAALFGPSALAEAPIAAIVGGDVVAGTVDRLLVEQDRVMVVDFKTGRRVPASAHAAPEHHLRQMSAYAAALEVIFPGRKVEAALLYTGGPKLICLPAALVALHKRGLTG